MISLGKRIVSSNSEISLEELREECFQRGVQYMGKTEEELKKLLTVEHSPDGTPGLLHHRNFGVYLDRGTLKLFDLDTGKHLLDCEIGDGALDMTPHGVIVFFEFQGQKFTGRVISFPMEKFLSRVRDTSPVRMDVRELYPDTDELNPEDLLSTGGGFFLNFDEANKRGKFLSGSEVIYTPNKIVGSKLVFSKYDKNAKVQGKSAQPPMSWAGSETGPITQTREEEGSLSIGTIDFPIPRTFRDTHINIEDQEAQGSVRILFEGYQNLRFKGNLLIAQRREDCKVHSLFDVEKGVKLWETPLDCGQPVVIDSSHIGVITMSGVKLFYLQDGVWKSQSVGPKDGLTIGTSRGRLLVSNGIVMYMYSMDNLMFPISTMILDISLFRGGNYYSGTMWELHDGKINYSLRLNPVHSDTEFVLDPDTQRISCVRKRPDGQFLLLPVREKERSRPIQTIADCAPSIPREVAVIIEKFI